MAKPRLQLTGKKFNFLTVIADAGNTPAGKSKWLVQCVCGVRKALPASEFTRSSRYVTKSCGCKFRELISVGCTTHGMSDHPAYAVWRSMIDRCSLPTHQAWGNYGGRGIMVCSSWVKSFTRFWSDMGGEYAPGLTLDRRDNEAGYSPENCRWVSYKVQSSNRRNNHRMNTPWGRLIISEASDKSGIGRTTLQYRISRGVTGKDLFRKPDTTNRFNR
jgi:hypothetical protein